MKDNKHKREVQKKGKNSKPGGGGKRRSGPGLPNVLRKIVHQPRPINSDDEFLPSDDANDVYEYEEGAAEEESRKNNRFDRVENYEYQLPDDFKDENVASDESDEEDDNRHGRMLQGITGLPADAFDAGEKKKNDDVIISEAYPESEYNPTCDTNGPSTLDLLNALPKNNGVNDLIKRYRQVEKASQTIYAPLPKPEQERIERKVAYKNSKKDLTNWEPLVKKNREAPTIYFDDKFDLKYSTVGEIAAQFEPRTDFEKNIASLVNDKQVVEAHRKDGARLLELNKVSVEDVMKHNNRLAKTKSLLFRHELKFKRIKKIKSKTYHRLNKKDKAKALLAISETDPEAAEEMAKKQEFKRAEERMTLKHKNNSKWAKRIMKRGLDAQDDNTRAAITEQLHKHAELTRKMNSLRDDSSSSEDNSDEDDSDELSGDSDQEGASKLLNKAKEKTLELLEGDEDLPKTGLLSLPFMVRGLKKMKDTADEEAKLAIEEYDLSLNQLDEKNGEENKKGGVISGRRVFGAPKTKVKAQNNTNNMKTDNFYDSDDDTNLKEDKEDTTHGIKEFSQREVNINPDVLREESEIVHDSLFKSFKDIAKDPGPNTTCEVAIFASNSWKKKKNISNVNKNVKNVKNAKVEDEKDDEVEEENDDESDDDSDSDSGHMVDGILTSGPKSSTYKLPTQAELVRRAFAGDNVEEDFEKDKQEVYNEENPEPEKPVLIPGWGQWTNIQKKKGIPSWMLDEHKTAKREREEAVKKRKDAHLNHVIISEKLDKKAEKLLTKTLPYPYNSKEVFEQSMRYPIGPEYNPVTVIGALNRPEVVKRSGLIIKPIQFKEVNPHERSGESSRGGSKKRTGKFVNGGSKKMIKAK